MSSNQKKPVLNQRFELAGNLLPRQIVHWFRLKTKVLGNFDTGPGLKNLVTLYFIHYAGAPIFWLRTRLRGQQTMHNVKALAKKIIARSDKPKP